MAIRRARLSLVLGTAMLLATAAYGAETVLTMQQVQGKNLLWLSATLTKCPTGYTQVTVQTANGPKKACVQNATGATSGGVQP
jgi:hypothetical protein